MSADIFNQGCRGNLRNDLGVIPGMYNDSGVESSEYLQQRYLDIPPKSESDSIPELEEVLSKLTPEDLEKRRRMFSVGRFSFDLGSDGYESPGSALMGHPGFKFMPYGVRTPDSLMSTGSREWTGSSGNYLQGISSHTVISNLYLRKGRTGISCIIWHLFSSKLLHILISKLTFPKKKWEVMKNYILCML